MIRRLSVGRSLAGLCLAGFAIASSTDAAPIWAGYAGNAQHTAVSTVASQSLQTIKWMTSVDLNAQYTNGEYLLIHYGSPVITQANTVIVPVKTGVSDGFKLEARNGATGSVKWSTPTTDYILPPHNWVPPYSPTLTSNGRVYYAGAGGTLWYRDNLDSGAPSAPTRVAFFGDANYAANAAAFNSSVFVNTPLTADAAGNIYFGYQVTGSNPLGLASGIAKVAPNGSATFVAATTAAADGTMTKLATNNAPAISADGTKVYVAVNSGNYTAGKLLALNTANLTTAASVALKDPKSGNNATIADDGTASTVVGPDGRVYFGVLESPFSTSKGWLTAFSGDLSQQKTTGGFGWDVTPSIVEASLVSSYHGSSAYLLMVKYNNYASTGGDGVNKLAILDPNDTEIDPRTGATVMKEIMSVAGVTPDADYVNSGFPNAVREWCINTAVVDPFTKSVLANSEDGKLYRWDLTTGQLSENIVLTGGLGEAYTPTLIGPDGTVYAINDATLFAVGAVPEPEAVGLVLVASVIGLVRRRQHARIA